MKVVNVSIVICLFFSNFFCFKNNIKIEALKINNESLFEKAIKYTSQVNDNLTKVGENFFLSNDYSNTHGISWEKSNELLNKILGGLSKVSTYQFKYSPINKSRYVDKVEFGIAFRNIITSIARDLVFNNLEYSSPQKTMFSQEVNNAVNFTKKTYFLIKEIIGDLFVHADLNHNMLISSSQFLNVFPFETKAPYVEDILKNKNPNEEESIDLEKAFSIFQEIVFRQNDLSRNDSDNKKNRIAETSNNRVKNNLIFAQSPFNLRKKRIYYEEIEQQVEDEALNK
jgi:hypothetical protein